MEKERRKRLEAAGWTVGTAHEFLGLDEREAAYVEMKGEVATRGLSRAILDPERIAKVCEANGIAVLRVFGSVARGEDSEDSDLDLLVRFTEPKTLLDVVRVEEELEQALERGVDLVTEGALHPRIRDRVMRDARLLYEHNGQVASRDRREDCEE